MYHIFFIHSSVDGHLGCFDVLATVNSAAMNIGVYVSLRIMVYLYNGILPTHKKNEIMPFAATWMDLEIIILSEVSQTEKDRYRMIFVCGI